MALTLQTTISYLRSSFTSINIQTLILLITLTYLLHRWTRHSNLPPGPRGLPILGYLPFFKGKKPHQFFVQLTEIYGNVISLYMGSVLVIVLGDYKAIKEAFVHQGYVFSGIPLNNGFKFKPTDKGLGLAEGEVAIQHRRFILSNLKDFGVGKTNLELKIIDEIKHLLLEIKDSNCQPIDIKTIIALSVANIVFLFEFGKRHDYTDAEFIYFRDLIETSSKYVGSVSTRIFFPWIKYIPFMKSITGYDYLSKVNDDIQQFFLNKINEVESNFVDGNRSNYTESYLTERNAIIKQTGSEGDFNRDELLGNLSFMYAAGMETVTLTLIWSLLYLIKYPHILQKVQLEIDDVIGSNRDPALSDKTNMPFTEATLLEIQRYISVLPFTLPHSNTEQTSLFGYVIPDRSYVIANLYAVHHDKSLWGDPENFRPERFMTAEGRVTKPEYLIPFSIGKRNCVGESLAQMELFLYFTSLLQQFNFQLPDGDTLSLDYDVGISLSPKPFKICARSRR